VTAMQIMRLVVVMLCAEPVLKLWLARQGDVVNEQQEQD